MGDHGLYGIYWHGTCTNTLEFFWDANDSPWPTDEMWMSPEAIEYERIDAGARDLVRAANASGWMQTIQVCEGHPDQDNAYGAHVELWVLVPKAIDVSKMFDWLQRAIVRRQDDSIVFKRGRLIDVEFIGKTRFGYYFCVFGRFVSSVENGRILRALTESLNGR